MNKVLQSSLPYDPFAARPLPGIQPLPTDEWLITDEAFAGQMAERDHLLRTARDAVLMLDETARSAADELLNLVLSTAYPDAGALVRRPDGRDIAIDRADPLGTLGRLVQEDFCLLQKKGDEHVLTGAVLCFPASWTLSEKFMRPLVGIHIPVAGYDEAIAKRVQRLFDGVRSGRPLWRFNTLWYHDPELHQPRPMQARRDPENSETGDFLRSEKQCILRLPETDAVVFSIHTFVLPRAAVIGAP